MNTHSSIRSDPISAPKVNLRTRFLAQYFHRKLDQIDRAILQGAIEISVPDGSIRILGGRNPGLVAKLSLMRWRALVRMAHEGSDGWYQAWEAGEWDSPDPVALFDLVMRNRATLGTTARATGLARIVRRISHWMRRNNRAGSRRNILAHYDLGNEFYALWLDNTMTYSSALFAEPINGEESLESAQRRKVEALVDRLELQPGSKLLEIGCGWGFFSRSCAQSGHDIAAITLSPEQKRFAEASSAHLAQPPSYELRDYRDVSGQFDAIASVEMVEAVGENYWGSYLDTITTSLKPGGRAALQFITIADDAFDAYAANKDFIQARIFPGGMLLCESKFRALAEARGLRWEEPHHFGLHYAETLRRWRVRFEDVVEKGLLPCKFDARFVRLWRYYLMYCEGGFRSGGISVAQVTLVKSG